MFSSFGGKFQEMQKDVANSIEGFERQVCCDVDVHQCGGGVIVTSVSGWKITNVKDVTGCRGAQEVMNDGGMMVAGE